MRKKIILGVSGGPDSMYLLEKYRKSLFHKPIVVHINYDKRETAYRDQKIVEEYCNKHKIKLYTFFPEDISKLATNFQAAARKYRFLMFKKVAEKEKTKLVALGHHKDDFIETALMQFKRSPSLPFYGIKSRNEIYGMEIVRPLLNKYKDELIDYLEKKEIKYGIDETNNQLIYERNRVRSRMSSKSKIEKDDIYNHFVELNKSKEKANKEFEIEYKAWKKSGYERKFFVESDNKERLIHELLNQIGVSSRLTKIDSIVRNIDANNSRKYRVGQGLSIGVEKGKIVVKDNNENWS